MNMIIENIGILTIFAIAVIYLIRKYFWNNNDKSCGGKNCDC